MLLSATSHEETVMGAESLPSQVVAIPPDEDALPDTPDEDGLSSPNGASNPGDGDMELSARPGEEDSGCMDAGKVSSEYQRVLDDDRGGILSAPTSPIVRVKRAAVTARALFASGDVTMLARATVLQVYIIRAYRYTKKWWINDVKIL